MVVGAVVVAVVLVVDEVVVDFATDDTVLPADVSSSKVPPKALMPAPEVELFKALKKRYRGWPW